MLPDMRRGGEGKEKRRREQEEMMITAWQTGREERKVENEANKEDGKEDMEKMGKDVRGKKEENKGNEKDRKEDKEKMGKDERGKERGK